MSDEVRPIPEGFHSLTPYLVVKDAAKAIDFYSRALGAQERYRMAAPDGSIMHAEIQVGDSILMLAEENPQMGTQSPQALNGTAVNLFLYVEDADASFKQAIDAGAKELLAPQDMFWGDRYGKLQDPFGHEWSIATHTEDLTPEQIGERAQAMFAEPAGGQ